MHEIPKFTLTYRATDAGSEALILTSLLGGPIRIYFDAAQDYVELTPNSNDFVHVKLIGNLLSKMRAANSLKILHAINADGTEDAFTYNLTDLRAAIGFALAALGTSPFAQAPGQTSNIGNGMTTEAARPVANIKEPPALSAQGSLSIPDLTGRIVDQNNTLSEPQRKALDEKLRRAELASGRELIVVLVDTTLPEDINDYAKRLGTSWKVGSRNSGKGALIVIAKVDRRISIQTSKELEQEVSNTRAQEIIDLIKPELRASDFAGGLNIAVDQLSGAATPTSGTKASEVARKGTAGGSGGVANQGGLSSTTIPSEQKIQCTRVEPEMPTKALQEEIGGTVRVTAMFENGVPVTITRIDGPKLFHESVTNAVMQSRCNDNEARRSVDFSFQFIIK